MNTMIYALVTLYNPTKQHVQNLTSVVSQVDTVIVCDNSNNNNENMIPCECKYSSVRKNLGLSAAFNLVLKNQDYGWEDDDYVIFMDQDSVIESDHVHTLVNDYETCRKMGIKIGCLGPIYYNSSNDSTEIPRIKKELIEGIFEVKSIITSSMLCRYGDLRTIGYWNEEIFLDMADWDLCWRFVFAGYKCIMSSHKKLLHSVGYGEKKIGNISLRVGAPIREYYQNRDCLYLFGKRYTPCKFRIRFVLLITVRNMIHIFFYDDKKERLNYIIRGIVDFFRGVHGEYLISD